MPIDKDKVKTKGTTGGPPKAMEKLAKGELVGPEDLTIWRPKSLKEINDTIYSPRADHLGGARRAEPDAVTGRTAPGEASKIMGGLVNARRR